MLVFAYIPWLAVSLGVASFAQPVLWTTLLAVVAAGWFAHRRWREAGPPRAEVVASEAVFWGVFALFLLLRAANPEIFWGEKPMDFSFLNTLYRASTLPPPEPWFSGSPLMYTYFGHYTVAAIGKTLAIHPAVMFNLGIAVVAGLTAAALFAAGSLLGGGWRVGAATAGLDAAARQPLRVARAAGAARGQLRLLLGHLPRHPQHDQRVPVLELRLRRPARARAGPPLGGGVRRPRDRVARTASGAHPPPPAHRLGRAAGAVCAPAGRDHRDQRLEPADLRRAPAGAPRRRLARARHARRVRTEHPHRRHFGGPAGRGRDRRRRPGVPAVLAAVLAPRQAVGRGGRPVRPARGRAHDLRVVPDAFGAVLLPDVAAHPRARRAAAGPPATRRDDRRRHRARAVAARPRRPRPPFPAPGGLDPDVRARDDRVRHLPHVAPRDARAAPPPAPARHLRVRPRRGVRVRVRLGPHEHGVQVLPRGVAPLRARVRHRALRALPRREGSLPLAARLAGDRRRGRRGGRVHLGLRRMGRRDAPARRGPALDARRHRLPPEETTRRSWRRSSGSTTT